MAMNGVERLLAERDIKDCLARYCHGIDRMDRELLDSVYWPEGYDDHDVWKGPAREFIGWVLGALSNFDQSVHMLGQSLIRFKSSDHAYAETYLFNYLRPKMTQGAGNDALIAGRYLDEFEQRRGEWRIIHRRLATDWVRELGPAHPWSEPILGGVWKMGARKPDDLSYVLGNFGLEGD